MEIPEALDRNKGIQLPTIKCPKCKMTWLAPGLIFGDTYECRGCGIVIVVGKSLDGVLQPTDEKGGD
jgi:hypothetical protein